MPRCSLNPPDLSSPQKRGPISPPADLRRKAFYFQRPASPRFRTFDRIAGVSMGPRFRGVGKLGVSNEHFRDLRGSA